MSFGEPHNPYGPPPQQPQGPQQPPAGPGYGYPQQGPPPQGYGIPQAPPVPQQGYPQYPGVPQYGGHPGGPTEMPGITRAARILVAVIALAHLIVAGSYLYLLSRWDEEMVKAGVTGDTEAEAFADIGKGFIVFLTGLAVVFAILGLVLLLQYAKGGNGVRVCSIVYGSFAIVTGLFMITAYGLGLILVAVSVLTIVFCARPASAAWFRRPRP